LSESSPYASARITESLMIAAIDGDPEARAIIESWRPQYKVTVLDPADPILQREGMVTFG
jgi:hypothetical protein